MKRLGLVMLAWVGICTPLRAAHYMAPDWMHALVDAPLPPHDEKTKAVLLYRDENLTVLSAHRFVTRVREAYKILRPEGREFGDVTVIFDSANERVTTLHAWCIPAHGEDYEVKDALDVSPTKDQSDELITDTRAKLLQVPAPDPGNIVGFEYVREWHPFFLQDEWEFQQNVPVRESHYSLTLPTGWEYKTAFVHYAEVNAHDAGNGAWDWTVGSVPEIRPEPEMPPWQGVAGRMVVTLFPPGGAAANTLPTWHDVGEWEIQLTSDRLQASPEIKAQVATLTAAGPTPVAKMRALAQFVQRNIRYVAIELGIGGVQPHPAAEVFTHRFGDCKDKATLLRSMLHEIGVESYYVVINVERGSVTAETPAYPGSFDHVVVAIKLPEGLTDPSLVATLQHPKLGTLLFFDPTNEKIPFGEIPGYLQANYGLLVTPTGGELVELPQEAAAMNGVRRSGKLILTTSGTLQGDVEEVYAGDRAGSQRDRFVAAPKASDQILPVERLLAASLSSFEVTHATVSDVQQTDRPLVWDYSLRADNYAKTAGNLLLVRPRVVGSDSSGLLEGPDPRRYPIEFAGPEQDTDRFEITLPPGYTLDDLPPAVDADFPFASYHSKTELAGGVLRYQRTFEVKELSVPVSQANLLRKFYRIIANDERNTAILKAANP